MRTRTGLLAMLLTAGMALAPTEVHAQAPTTEAVLPPQVPIFEGLPYRARGQLASPTNDYDVPRADPAYPVPLYHDRPESGGFFASAEVLWWRQTNPVKHQLIAVRGFVDTDGSVHEDLGDNIIPVFGQPFQNQGVTLPGGFIGSAQPALHADDLGPNSYVPGYCITLGYRFREGFVGEVSWTHLQNSRLVGGATLIPQGQQLGPILADSFLFSPVYNFTTFFAGPPNKLAVGNPLAVYGIWNGASEMSIMFDQHYDEWNIGARIPMVETDCWRCYGFAGVRHVWFWENFKWRTVSMDFLGQADAIDAAVYDNIVSNSMYGGYVGWGNECYLGHGFSVSLDCKTALMVNFVREIAKYTRQDEATQSKRSRRVYTIVPELDAQMSLWWYPIEGVELRLGYDVKNFFNTIAAKEPVTFNYNGVDPPWSHQAWRLVDGFRFGIGLIF